jgi:microcystin-dependent protein
MGTPYVGEIRMVGFNFAPAGWALCNGALLPISEYETLFNLIGTTYGGDGQSTFAVPNLAGRVPLHMGTGNGLSPRIIGEVAGVEQITLINSQMPQHSHVPQAQSANGALTNPQNAIWASSTAAIYSTDPPNVPMRNGLVNPAGGNQPHKNMMPFLVINFVISLFGIFPTPN